LSGKSLAGSGAGDDQSGGPIILPNAVLDGTPLLQAQTVQACRRSLQESLSPKAKRNELEQRTPGAFC